MKNNLLIYLFVFITYSSTGQKTIFHDYVRTASDIHIENWNIEKNNLSSQYVEETIDSKGRVTELKFYREESLKYSHLCYLSVWIKYEYPNDTTIVALFLDSDGKENAEIECEIPSKTTYWLSDDQRTIVKSISEYNLDKQFYLDNGWTESELKSVVQELKRENRLERVVSYYSKSYAKYDNVYPVSSDFDKDNLYFSEKEKDEIDKILRK
jgi:hypothetical protein